MEKFKLPKGAKILSEQETRANMMSLARELGCTQELKMIFDLTDAKLRNCTNEVERREIAIEGMKLIERLLTATPESIEMDGKIVKL